MNTQVENVTKAIDLKIVLAMIAVILFLNLISQCGTSKKCSALQVQNKDLLKKIDDVKESAITTEQLKFALQENTYQLLTLQEQMNKGKMTAEQMQKNLSDIKRNISEIKKTSEHEGTH